MAAAARCPSLVLMLILSCTFSGAASAAATDEKLTHLHFYFHEVVPGAPNATAVDVVSLNKGAPAFGNVNVFDNVLREGPDPASRFIGRVQGIAVNASLDGSGTFSAFDIVFSGDYAEYSGSALTAQGRYDPMGGPSERSIVGGTGKLRFARGYMKSRLVSSTNTTIVVVFDVYFTLAH